MFDPEKLAKVRLGTVLPVKDHQTARPLILTDRERIWLAGLLTKHLESMAEYNPACEIGNNAAECFRDMAWGMGLRRRLREGVEL